MYHLQENINEETLVNDEQFITDATSFLMKREGKDLQDLATNKDVYDAFMEHFRYQNVNEVTATRDLFYAQDADTESKNEFHRLMDAYDKADTDLGLNALGDYLGGTFTAPSTYAGIFSFGAGKAGALAAQQGIKFGIRKALKKGAETAVVRRQMAKSAAASAAVDLPFTATLVASQEQTRKELNLKDDFDLTNVAFATGLGTIASGGFGAITGRQRVISSNIAEQVRMVGLKKEAVDIKDVHLNITSSVLKSKKTSNIIEGNTIGDDAKLFANELKEGIRKTRGAFSKTKEKKLPLKETVGKEIKKGEKLKKQKDFEEFEIEVETKLLENIASAASLVLNKIKPIGKLDKKGDILKERITSRISRGLATNQITSDEIGSILSKHKLTYQKFSSIFAAEASGWGRQGATYSKLSRAEKAKRLAELSDIDKKLVNLGETDPYVKALIEKNIKGNGSKTSHFYENWFALGTFNKARIALMTVQFATTARNTTNGYMRNYVYGLDNIGTGIANTAYGTVKSITNKQLRQEGKDAVRLGIAQMRTGAVSLLGKDLWFGTQSWETQALAKMFQDPKFGKSAKAKELFKELGDIADMSDAEGGLMHIARKANYLNTLSDNMFKRAVFAREVDKQLIAAGEKNGLRGFFERNYLEQATSGKITSDGKFSNISDNVISKAMDEALAFTYQIGRFRGKEGKFNKGADFFIDLASNGATGFLVSQGIPFPRYLVNQFIFLYEHTPILGLYDMGGILRKTGNVAAPYSERFGKQFGGLATLAAFYGLRCQFGDETTGPYEYKNPMGTGTFMAEANLGPFMGMAAIADLLYKHTGPNRKPLFGITNLPQLHDNDKVAVDIPYKTRDLVKAFTGGTARAGVGLDIIDGVSDLAVNFDNIKQQSFEESLARVVGNFFNTFTVGAGMLKDIAGTFLGPEYRVVQNNTSIDMMEYMFKQAARSIPQKYEPAEGDMPSFNPTRSTPRKSVNPFLKLVTGITEQEEKSTVEKELARLRFDFSEVSPTKVKLDAPMTNLMRLRMGQYVEKNIADYITKDEYRKNLGSDVLKRTALKNKINHYRGLAKKEIANISFDDSDNLEIQQRKYRAKFNSLPSNTKKILIEHYETVYNSDFSENMRDWRDNSIYETLMKDLQYYVRKKLVPNPQ